jgi:hypothetical protein
MPAARGENSVTSVPRARWKSICGCTLSASSSSLILRAAGFCEESRSAAICA